MVEAKESSHSGDAPFTPEQKKLISQNSQCYDNFVENGQAHVFNSWFNLSEEQQKQFDVYLSKLNVKSINEIFKALVTDSSTNPDEEGGEMLPLSNDLIKHFDECL